MKKTLLLIIVSFSTFSILAQDTYLKWAKQFAGGLNGSFDRGQGIEVDANGNVYSTGIFTGTVDFDPGPGTFNLTSSAGVNFSVYISKLDIFGNFLWARQITGASAITTRSLALDKDLNIYVTGDFSFTVDFDPGPGVSNLTAIGDIDVFIVKLTTNGDLMWAKQIGGPAANAGSFSTATDSFGNVYFTGNFTGSLDFDPGPGTFAITSTPGIGGDAFVCNLDPAGNFNWAGSMGGNQSDRGLGISIDALNNIYLTGSYRFVADFDPGPGVFNLIAQNLDDVFILKLSSSGNFVWAKTVGGLNTEWAYKAIADGLGNVYITGFFIGTADFDPGPGVYNMSSVGADAVFVLKLNVSGNFVWARSMGGLLNNNWGIDLKLDVSGNIYTTGFFIGPADFDPGPGIFILNSTVVDVFISKLDNSGNFIWAKSLGGIDQDQGLSLALDKFKNIYTTGHFGFTADFDLETPTYFLTASDVSDPFVLKVSQCNNTTYATITDSACKTYTLNGQTYDYSGTYQQVIFNSSGCDSIITLNLYMYRISSTVNAKICPGQSYYAGGANQTTAGIYKDTLISTLGCDSIITTNLSLYPKPNPNLGFDRNICANESGTITPGIFNSYLWQDNSIKPDFTLSSSINKYWVKVTDANNCTATDTLNILGIDTIPKDFLPTNQELCYGHVLRIAVGGYFTYQWSTGSIGDFIDINTFGTFYLTVKDFNLCTGTDSITIQRKNCFPIGIPNAFTPNGDTKNDIFSPIIFQHVKAFSFFVFNRYGQKIFETTEYGKGWDGTFRGKAQPTGSYVYRIKFTNIFGWESIENGSVLLIR